MCKRKQPSPRPQAKHKKNRSPSQFDKRERLDQRNPRRKKTKRAKVPLVGPMLADDLRVAAARVRFRWRARRPGSVL